MFDHVRLSVIWMSRSISAYGIDCSFAASTAATSSAPGYTPRLAPIRRW
jgi:hypothetical protein